MPTSRAVAVFAVLLVAAAAAAAQPAVEVTLSGLGTWRPAGKGEAWKQESRWKGDLGQYRLHLDARADGQIRLTVCRDWADLPPPDSARVDVRTLTVTGAVTYRGEHRFHPHTCPTRVWNRSPMPAADMAALVASGAIPPYDTGYELPADTLQRVAAGRYPWERFPGRFKSPHDAWTEDYAAIVAGYSGGAIALGGTEAAPLMPHQVAWLLTGDRRAWDVVRATAEASGNFAIHYRSRATGRVVQPAESAGLPFLQREEQAQLESASGKRLPLPDVAHQHSLVYLAAVVTGERFYFDELEAWAAFNWLTRPPREERSRGIVYSGQIRATAWALRALHEVVLAAPAGEREKYAAQLRANLDWMASHVATPGGSHYRPSGLAPQPAGGYRPGELTVHYAPDVTSDASTWNHHVLAWVLDRLAGDGYERAAPTRDHLLRVIRGVVKHSPTVYDWPWGLHADGTAAGPLEDWAAIVAKTFAGRKKAPAAFGPPVTQHYASWARSAVLAAVAAGEPWAPAALARLDTAIVERWGSLPVDWAMTPRRTPKGAAARPGAPRPRDP